MSYLSLYGISLWLVRVNPTVLLWVVLTDLFYIFIPSTNLQGSQTCIDSTSYPVSFYISTNLQGSQTISEHLTFTISFTYLQTYKVLKRALIRYSLVYCFTYLQTYKVLKPLSNIVTILLVLHIYKLTRFSNHNNKPTERFTGFTYLQTYKVLKQRRRFFTW